MHRGKRAETSQRKSRSETELPAVIKKYLQVFTALHQILDIINYWEVQAKNLEEVHLLLRQVSVGQNLDQISEVIATATQTCTYTSLNYALEEHTGRTHHRAGLSFSVISDKSLC